jgi:hypothetical protein
VKVELGLSVAVGGFIGHYCLGQLNQLVLAYSVLADGHVHTGQEIAEVRYLTPGALKDWNFGPLEITSAIVARWLDGRVATLDRSV